MASRSIEIQLDKIEQGEFKNDCQAAIEELSRAFVEHIETYGKSAAASLAMKVGLKYNSETKGIAIVTDITKTLPKKPSGVTTAFIETAESGEKTLFTLISGSTDGDPKQQLLCSEKGGTIDKETGEILVE